MSEVLRQGPGLIATHLAQLADLLVQAPGILADPQKGSRLSQPSFCQLPAQL